MNNWTEFIKNNIINKEVRIKIATFTPVKSGSDVEKEINACLSNEQADDVITKIEDNHIVVQYTRYQQYQLTNNGYVPTGIFHSKDIYDVFHEQRLTTSDASILEKVIAPFVKHW